LLFNEANTSWTFGDEGLPPNSSPSRNKVIS
jgi:hypothetical protein